MNKRVLLIYPPSPVMNREDRCQQPTKDLLVIPPLPPTDLMYLAAIAEQVGCQAKIADYSLGGDITKDLITFRPDYIVANIATPTYKSDLAILEVGLGGLNDCTNIVNALLELGMIESIDQLK